MGPAVPLGVALVSVEAVFYCGPGVECQVYGVRDCPALRQAHCDFCVQSGCSKWQGLP